MVSVDVTFEEVPPVGFLSVHTLENQTLLKPEPLPVPNKPYGFCGRKATFEEDRSRSAKADCSHVGEQDTAEVGLTAQTENPAESGKASHRKKFRSCVRVEVAVLGCPS